jgi:elongation factor G
MILFFITTIFAGIAYILIYPSTDKVCIGLSGFIFGTMGGCLAAYKGKYKKQTGGRGQYGDVWIEVEPLERGKSFEFVDKIVGGAIPRNFIPSVEKGFKQAMLNGPLAGYEMDSMKVRLFDGSFHAVDSDQLSFELAAKMG